ncbi:DUF805 domain-containing protein [Massilia sp. TWP1-3-3]|uniref:DUF805 domain-containing protein n=1 Tax=Massilia sp. TWP1-3-3 TaxID=2804573 RepID=UPI003CED0138
MHNPYHAPSADLSQAQAIGAPYVPAFFAVHGRLGRLRYVAYMTGSMLLASLATGVVVTAVASMLARDSPLLPFLTLPSTVSMVAAWAVVAVRRLNDMNRSGWMLLLGLVPIVNLGLGLWLLFGPGDGNANNYGRPPCKNSTGVIVACVACVLSMVAVIGFSALAFYAVTRIAGGH